MQQDQVHNGSVSKPMTHLIPPLLRTHNPTHALRKRTRLRGPRVWQGSVIPLSRSIERTGSLVLGVKSSFSSEATPNLSQTLSARTPRYWSGYLRQGCRLGRRSGDVRRFCGGRRVVCPRLTPSLLPPACRLQTTSCATWPASDSGVPPHVHYQPANHHNPSVRYAALISRRTPDYMKKWVEVKHSAVLP